jgi:glucose-1-phosphate cytidylyltransferase
MPRLDRVTALLLCGGQGLRAWPLTEDVPKPLIDVSGKRLMEYVMELMADQGVTRFVLAAGRAHLQVSRFARSLDRPWDVQVAATGDKAETWQRVVACRKLLSEPFFLAYSDCLANIDLDEVRKIHERNAALGTITVAPMLSQSGLVDVEPTGKVMSFTEKPWLSGQLINIGFMMIDRELLNDKAVEQARSLEREVLPYAAKTGRLFAHRHQGFYKTVDTYKDATELREMVEAKSLPWLAGELAGI